jgi:hypothetical protein
MKRVIPIMLIALLVFAQAGISTDVASGDPVKANVSAGALAGTKDKGSAPPGKFTFLPYPPAFGASHLLPAPEVPENGKTSPHTSKASGPETIGLLSPKEKENGQPGFAFIDIAKAKDYREMDILGTAPKEHRAEFFLGFRLLPDTEVLLGKGIRLERTPTDSFAPYDDGWRFKFKKNF